jgi:CheY-like chemotaxis protein/anti-sigma regulatory factor (Ser/Thr protein kinase)
MELAWDTVPVIQLCEASLRLIGQSAKRKKLHVTSDVDPLCGTLQCDARRMKQLLVNLLGNAVKFTPEGGDIGLNVTTDSAKGQIHFTVWDTGIGIPEALQQKLFQPFVQLDSQLTRRYSGTGLGLALVYRMAELHGGRVSVESTPGEGSRFSVYLPWKMEQVMQDAALDKSYQQSADPVRGRPKLLLADDNKINADMLARYLRSMGYEVSLASDGVEVVASALASPPDIILMDIQLPNMDGLEATRRLRSHAKLRYTPIIALTALAMPGDRERCMEAGVDDYLSKPVGLKELHQVLHSWLDAD